jgi:hypothetical protein
MSRQAESTSYPTSLFCHRILKISTAALYSRFKHILHAKTASQLPSHRRGRELFRNYLHDHFWEANAAWPTANGPFTHAILGLVAISLSLWTKQERCQPSSKTLRCGTSKRITFATDTSLLVSRFELNYTAADSHGPYISLQPDGTRQIFISIRFTTSRSYSYKMSLAGTAGEVTSY